MNLNSALEGILKQAGENYGPLTEECVADLLKCSTILEAGKHEILVKEGQYSDKSFYIIKGSARAYYLKDGKDISDWFAFENDFISSVNSFFQDVPSPHYIEIMEESVLMLTRKKDFLLLCDKHHCFERLVRNVVTRTMLQLQQRIVGMQFESARQRYENLLNVRPDIILRVPLTHIASYLGITLETLSRIRNQHK
jgi:CRP-like cAMP-binding protein